MNDSTTLHVVSYYVIGGVVNTLQAGPFWSDCAAHCVAPVRKCDIIGGAEREGGGRLCHMRYQDLGRSVQKPPACSTPRSSARRRSRRHAWNDRSNPGRGKRVGGACQRSCAIHAVPAGRLLPSRRRMKPCDINNGYRAARVSKWAFLSDLAFLRRKVAEVYEGFALSAPSVFVQEGPA
jgi:hypothetical protein